MRCALVCHLLLFLYINIHFLQFGLLYGLPLLAMLALQQPKKRVKCLEIEKDVVNDEVGKTKEKRTQSLAMMRYRGKKENIYREKYIKWATMGIFSPATFPVGRLFSFFSMWYYHLLGSLLPSLCNRFSLFKKKKEGNRGCHSITLCVYGGKKGK